MCNEQQNEDQILTSVAERYKVKVIRREDLKEDMITFENAGDPDLLICLEPDPSAVKPDNNSLKSTLTTLSDKRRGLDCQVLLSRCLRYCSGLTLLVLTVKQTLMNMTLKLVRLYRH